MSSLFGGHKTTFAATLLLITAAAAAAAAAKQPPLLPSSCSLLFSVQTYKGTWKVRGRAEKKGRKGTSLKVVLTLRSSVNVCCLPAASRNVQNCFERWGLDEQHYYDDQV